jgi:putative tricarboxylic transport membrane protein
MFEPGLDALSHLATPAIFGALVLGVALGLITGALPAGANLPVLIVLMGFAFHLDPFIGVAIVIGHLAVAGTTDPIPCILMGIPGSASAQATVLDGYPLARKGRAGYALSVAYTASLMGGLIGATGLLLSIPVARQVLRVFGSPEFFLLGLMGIAVVGIVSSGALLRGLLAGCLGLTLALVGTDPVRGVTRATLGWEFLWDGIDLVPAIVGLFAVPEILNLVVSGTPIARDQLDRVLQGVNVGRKEGMLEAWHHKWLVMRSSLVGLFIGMLPGVGGAAAHWMAYAQARQTERGATKTFGTGDIRGVIAPESANNSIDGGILIPTLTFGIPGSGGMAVFLGFLILLGFQPGPIMLENNMNMVLFIVLCLALSNVMATLVALGFTPQLARVASVRPDVLAPMILALLAISTYQSTRDLRSFAMVGFFALLGWFMKRYGWPRPPILIALVLSRGLEKYLSLAMNTFGWGILLRPQSLALIALGLAAVVFLLRVQRDTQQAAVAAEVTAEGAAT